MRFLKDVFYLFFPRVCLGCDEPLVKNEKDVCLKCRFELPLTDFTNEVDNKVEKAFYGRVAIEYATALLFYRRKGITQKLIYQLKYKGKQEIGNFLGVWLGEELKNSVRFPSIDYIVPVPLHPKKLKKRGYNQLTTFGRSISTILQVPYNDTTLIRKSVKGTQTSKSRFERWKNVNEIFDVIDTNIFKDKHVLLIDDVITTGATLEACVLKLTDANTAKISIATMVFTD